MTTCIAREPWTNVNVAISDIDNNRQRAYGRPLLFEGSRKNQMSVIAEAIADRHSEIERLQAEIKPLNDVDKILGTSAPPDGFLVSRSG